MFDGSEDGSAAVKAWATIVDTSPSFTREAAYANRSDTSAGSCARAGWLQQDDAEGSCALRSRSDDFVGACGGHPGIFSGI